MRLGILGDLHLRSAPPINRIDDYYQTQFNKLYNAFDMFKTKGCDAVLQPGDWFNSYGRDPLELIFDVISFVKSVDIPIYSLFGQHDLKFHNIEVVGVPLQILMNAGLINRIPIDGKKIGKNTYLYGMHFGQKTFPKPKNGINILVAHKMVINGKKIFPGQTDYIQAKMLTKKGFDLCVTGDNHKAFIYKDKESIVVNCGSLCRMKIDQTEHKPQFAIYDTKTHDLQVFNYPIKPASSVLKEEEIREKQADSRRREEFSKSLDSDFDAELDYRKNIKIVMDQQRRTKKRTKEILEEGLNVKTV